MVFQVTKTLCNSSVYSCHLILIPCFSAFLSFIMPILIWNVSLVSVVFLKRSIVFSILLFLCIVHLRRISYLSILWNYAFSWIYIFLFPLLFAFLLFLVICKAFSDNHSIFLHFFFFGKASDICAAINSETSMVKSYSFGKEIVTSLLKWGSK